MGSVIASNASNGVISSNTSATNIFSGPFITSGLGINPIFVFRWYWPDTSPPATYYQIRSANLAVIRPLYTADSVAGVPDASNVRSGTVYGPSNELTGTCAVPPAGSVALGVPVDATTGTAAITAANIRSALGLASANLDTQLAAIPTAAAPNAATVASQVRTELATELARLDAAISTRLATSGYTTPPTTAAIATAVNAALDRTGYSLTSAERQAIATAVEQSILNENDGQAILNAIVGAIGNQNVDQIALVAAIRADLERNGGTLATRSTLTAGQVRTELSTELGRIDTTVSSRLAPGGTLARVTLTDTVTTLTNAPDVPTEAEIADAVRTELAPELARLSNVATTQEVGDIVEGALSD